MAEDRTRPDLDDATVDALDRHSEGRGTGHTHSVTTPDPARPAAPKTPPGSTPPRPRRGRGVGLTLAAVLLIAVTVLLVLFVVFNTQTVRISMVFGDVEAPLVLALVLAAVLGGLIVGLWSLVRRTRRSGR